MNLEDLKNKKIAVVGAGISGIAAAEVAAKAGAAVQLFDTKPIDKLKADKKVLEKAGIKCIFGDTKCAVEPDTNFLIVSPAVPVRVPFVQDALQKGVCVISEVEFAWRLSKAPLFAITGTNGKTTTTTLAGLLMEQKYEAVGVGGNIGVPLCKEAVRIPGDGCIVAEISSYQLEASIDFRPHIAAILNVTPDHLARHGSMEVYQATKEKIFAKQDETDYLVLNYDDSAVRQMAERSVAKVMFFSRQTDLKEGAIARDGQLLIRWEGKEHVICPIDEMRIKGSHNVENALCAIAMAFLAGVPVDKMGEVLRSFPGVEHRIESVDTINGVMYYNDSKATNPEAAIKALETFPEHIILIAGGHDKNTDLTSFMRLVCARVDKLILVGNAAQRFYKAAVDNGFSDENILQAGYSMEKAVEIAAAMAKPPQLVLLSPACASFDMYEGYEARGRDFKNIVKSLQAERGK